MRASRYCLFAEHEKLNTAGHRCRIGIDKDQPSVDIAIGGTAVDRRNRFPERAVVEYGAVDEGGGGGIDIGPEREGPPRLRLCVRLTDQLVPTEIGDDEADMGSCFPVFLENLPVFGGGKKKAIGHEQAITERD